jgi:hypothetical protein
MYYNINNYGLNDILSINVRRGDIEVVEMLLDIFPQKDIIKQTWIRALSSKSDKIVRWLIETKHITKDSISMSEAATLAATSQNAPALKALLNMKLITRDQIVVSIRESIERYSTINESMVLLLYKLGLAGEVSRFSRNQIRGNPERLIGHGIYPDLDEDHRLEIWELLMHHNQHPSKQVIHSWLISSKMDKLQLLETYNYPLHSVEIDRCRNCLDPKVILWLKNKWSIVLSTDSCRNCIYDWYPY